MWTNNNRGRYDLGKLRYPSDMTDDEWGLIRPLVPLAHYRFGAPSGIPGAGS
jgi:hypothetical protein